MNKTIGIRIGGFYNLSLITSPKTVFAFLLSPTDMTYSCSVSVLVVSGKLNQVPIGVPDIHRGDGPMGASPADRTQTVDMTPTERGNHIIQRILHEQTQVNRAGRRPVRLGVNLMARLMNIDLCAQVASISRLTPSRTDASPAIHSNHLSDRPR